MPLDVLFQCGLLFAAVVTAFAVSAVVGMLVAGLGAPPRSVGQPSNALGSLPRRPDPVGERAATPDRPPAVPARRVAEGLESAG
jgi:hypothetical protein